MAKRTTCKAEGCDRKLKALGFCLMHYTRFRKQEALALAAELGVSVVEVRPPQRCKWPQCSADVRRNKAGASLGYCPSHHKWNVSRGRSGMTYAQYDDLMAAGRRLTAGGYVQIRSGDRWVAEHRAVMERVLGRALADHESVHHRNGDRADNSPENLELWVGGIRYGQRATDIVCPHCGESYA